MKRQIFAVLMTVCSVSLAGWERAGSTVSSDIYVDTETIRKKGIFFEMWSMDDYYEEQLGDGGASYKSSKTLARYDCSNETLGVISDYQYAGNLGEGKVVDSHTIKKNEIRDNPIVPQSYGEAIWKIVCRRK